MLLYFERKSAPAHVQILADLHQTNYDPLAAVVVFNDNALGK